MLEVVEDRLAPANLLYVGGANAPWTADAKSWVNINTNQWATPQAKDNLTFDPSLQVMTPDGMKNGSIADATDPNTNDIANLTVGSKYTGTISFQPGVNYTNVTGMLTLAGGTLGSAPGVGTATLVLNNNSTSNWTGGAVNLNLDVGPFGLIKQADAKLMINGGTNPVVLGGALYDFGTVYLTGAGIAEDGGTVGTNPWGVFNITSDASLTQQAGGAAPGKIDNQGTFEKTGGGGTSTIANPFYNDGSSEGSGILLAGSGTLSLTNATTYQDGFNVQGNVTLNGGLSETHDAAFTPANGMQFPFLKATGTFNGDFATKQYTNNSWSVGTQNNLYFDSALAAGVYSLVVKQM
jgi:hypothetical protein